MTPERFRSVYCWLAVYCRVQPYMHSILMDFQYNYNTGDWGQVADERRDAVHAEIEALQRSNSWPGGRFNGGWGKQSSILSRRDSTALSS